MPRASRASHIPSVASRILKVQINARIDGVCSHEVGDAGGKILPGRLGLEELLERTFVSPLSC